MIVEKSNVEREAYNKQGNYVVSFLRVKGKNFYSSLDTKVVINNEIF